MGKRLTQGAVVALDGPLGAGKTTFVKGIAKALGITEEITSPSFTIISEYRGTVPLYHMDLYRIDTIEEFELIGPEEMIDGEGISIIEWAHKAKDFFPKRTISVTFTMDQEGKRIIKIEGIQG